MMDRYVCGYLAVVFFGVLVLLDSIGCSLILQPIADSEDPEEEFTVSCFQLTDSAEECELVVVTEENSQTLTGIVTGCSELGAPEGDIWTISGSFIEPEDGSDVISATITATWYQEASGYEEVEMQGFFDTGTDVLTLRVVDNPAFVELLNVDCGP